MRRRRVGLGDKGIIDRLVDRRRGRLLIDLLHQRNIIFLLGSVIRRVKYLVGFSDGGVGRLKIGGIASLDRRLGILLFVAYVGAGIGWLFLSGILLVGRIALCLTGIDLLGCVGNELRAVRSQHRNGISLSVGIVYLARSHGEQTLHLALDRRVGILGLQSAVVLDSDQLMHRAGEGGVYLVYPVLEFVKRKIHVVTGGSEVGADHRSLLRRVSGNADDILLILH